MITTTESSIVDFWKERGFEPSFRYEADGISCWDIDVPEDHADLKHPDFIEMLIQEKMSFPAIIRKRLQTPVYTIKDNGHYGLVDQPHFKNAMPIAHSKQLLQFAFTNPATGECPSIVPLKDSKSVRRILGRMRQGGAEAIMYFATIDVAETISIDEAINSLEELLH